MALHSFSWLTRVGLANFDPLQFAEAGSALSPGCRGASAAGVGPRPLQVVEI